jgi:ADP-heptose:LPS heptosyltransferase
MRIVVNRAGALGDTLLTFPALAALREQWPDAQLTLICRGDVQELALASGLADSVYRHELADWASLFDAGATPSALARAVLAGANLALMWAPDADGAMLARLRAKGVGEPLVAAPPPLAGSGQHIALELLGALSPLGIAVPVNIANAHSLAPALRWPQAAQHATEAAWKLLEGELARRPPVAIHPGSGGASKRWPTSHVAALIHELRRDYAPVLIAGPQDEEVVAQVVATAGAIPTVRDLSVAGLAAFLSTCALYVGNDSGVTHLAGMLGLPTIALFGPTDPALWTPLGPRVVTLRSPSGRMGDLPVEMVVAATRRRSGHP